MGIRSTISSHVFYDYNSRSGSDGSSQASAAILIYIDGVPYNLNDAAYELTSTTAVGLTVLSPTNVDIFAWGGGGGEGETNDYPAERVGEIGRAHV